ncbi:MAG: hypothetical protein AAF773_10805 [Cyanobacteria bacterium P01_D01_bin.115]
MLLSRTQVNKHWLALVFWGDRDRLTLNIDPSLILWPELCLPLPTVR